MLFNSFQFIGFFLVVYGLYLATTRRVQNPLLLAASYLFYAAWDARFLGLILASTLVDYFCALGMEQAPVRTRRRYLALSLATNLGILATYKYFDFFAGSLATLLTAAGWEVHWGTLNLILPMGISFYTFQTMSYTIDVYRGGLKPERNLLDFALYVAYFPQLVAGPIERASRLLPQIKAERFITRDQFREGAWLLLYGYFLKTVLADNLAPFVNEVFDAPGRARGLAIPLALVAFAFQIYGDFAGYSNIARGLSKWMGIELMVNFRMPYLATNPSDFWRRWHISLSTWLRDYLFIPLGGSRAGSFRTLRNLMLTMFLGGLWHGAAWHFVAWGLYHGLWLALHRVAEPWLARVRPAAGWAIRAWLLVRWAVCFGMILFGWLLFRVNHLHDLPRLVQNTVSPLVLNGQVAALSLLVFALPVFLLDLAAERRGRLLVFQEFPGWLRTLVTLFLLASIVLAGSRANYAFIYIQF